MERDDILRPNILHSLGPEPCRRSRRGTPWSFSVLFDHGLVWRTGHIAGTFVRARPGFPFRRGKVIPATLFRNLPPRAHVSH